MKKMDVSYKDKEAILKVKEDSLVIVTDDDEIIKIDYSNIKSYSYKNENLTIKQQDGEDVTINVDDDEELFDALDEGISSDSKKNDSKSDKKDDEDTNVSPLLKNLSNEEREEFASKINETQRKIGRTWAIFILAMICIPILYLVLNSCSVGCSSVQCSRAEQYALENLSEVSYTPVSKNELSCKAMEETSDGIVIVKCTTTNDYISSYYKSTTIYSGYSETADGRSYSHFEHADKETVLEKMRK